MNTRLDALYNRIESENRDTFLANKIVPDETWGKKISGGTLQIDLTDAVRDQVEIFQQELDVLEPGNLLLLPRPYQHISFNQVVFWGGNYKYGPQQTWDTCKDNFSVEFLKLDKAYSSFPIVFNRLIATSNALIYVAGDGTDELEKLRIAFAKILPFPDETQRFNHIIHTTVARFKNTLNNPRKVWEYVANKHVSCVMEVKSIVLREEHVYPSIDTTELARIQLLG